MTTIKLLENVKLIIRYTVFNGDSLSVFMRLWKHLVVFCLQLLQQNLETNFYSGQVSWDDVSPNDAAALLKKFIRELPAPLLTAEYLNTFSAVRGQWTPFNWFYCHIWLFFLMHWSGLRFWATLFTCLLSNLGWRKCLQFTFRCLLQFRFLF